MISEESVTSPPNPKRSPPKRLEALENRETMEGVFSPGFRSVAAMAGWDEEALLIASLVVEDTPDRQVKHKKRPDLHFKTPPASSRRKRRAQRRSPVSIPVTVLDLEDDQPAREDDAKTKAKSTDREGEEEKRRNNVGDDDKQNNGSDSNSSSSSPEIPCLDRLREELSCAICLEICFEPSTTTCGHSFCKKCMKSAADKCGKRCPKCRQLMSNGRSCTVNTVLWNTIQLLFPQEVEARKAAAGASNGREAEHRRPAARASSRYGGSRVVQALNSSPEAEQSMHKRRRQHQDLRNRSFQPSAVVTSREDVGMTRRREVASQDEDAALALRLQREEFMEAFRRPDEVYRSSVALARANLRAMASRAINIRVRGGRAS